MNPVYSSAFHFVDFQTEKKTCFIKGILEIKTKDETKKYTVVVSCPKISYLNEDMLLSRIKKICKKECMLNLKAEDCIELPYNMNMKVIKVERKQKFWKLLDEQDAYLPGLLGKLAVRDKTTFEITQRRRGFAKLLFQEEIGPHITELLRDEHRNPEAHFFAAGFNRLFSRQAASVGSDIDFVVIVNTKDEVVLAKIRTYIRNVIKPGVNKHGIDIESADIFILDLDSYKNNLDETKTALFTLAFMKSPSKKEEYVHLLAGSKPLLKKSFSLSNAQIMNHYFTFLQRNCDLSSVDTNDLEKELTKKLKNPLEKKVALDHLQRMAFFELCYSSKPFSSKQKTTRTILGAIDWEKRLDRSQPFPIKYAISRFPDLFHATSLKPENFNLSDEMVDTVERLGIVLSNISAYQEKRETIFESVPEKYQEITLEQLQNLSLRDRTALCDLLGQLGVEIQLAVTNPEFNKELYDVLWLFADELQNRVNAIELKIFKDACAFIRPIP